MSRFIDKLNQTLRTGPQTMGFRRGQSVAPKPKILLVASLSQAGVSNLADWVAGADAGLLQISGLEEGIKTLCGYAEAVPDIPWGGWLRGGMREISLKGVGCDFVIFPADTPLGVLENTEVGKIEPAGKKYAEVGLKNTEVGKILEVEAQLGEGLLKTIDELPVDGVLIAGKQEEGYPLTWQHLMLFRHFADSVAKPLLVPIPSKVTANELQMLWEAGVDCVIVEVGATQPPGKLRKLREAIDKLTFPSPRRRGRAEALVPQVRSEGTEVEIETEEE